MIEIGVLILLAIAFATLEITLIFLLKKHFNDIKEFNKAMEENYKVLNEFTDKKLESIKYEIKELMAIKEYFNVKQVKEKEIKKREDTEEKKSVKPIKMEYDNEIKRLEPINPKELENLYNSSQTIHNGKNYKINKSISGENTNLVNDFDSMEKRDNDSKKDKPEYTINRNYKTHIVSRKDSYEVKKNDESLNNDK